MGLTLQEAIKSRKPFKETDGNDWLIVDDEGYVCIEDGLRSGMIYSFNVDALLATDWETKKMKKKKERVDSLIAQLRPLKLKGAMWEEISKGRNGK